MPFPTVAILYATATGTAEDIAHALAHRFRTTTSVTVSACAAVDTFTLPALLAAAPTTLFIFILATAGDGEAPASMRSLWTALRDARLGPSALAPLSLAVFGLGDSGYVKFNAAARRFGTRVADLGAHVVGEIGLGNDAVEGSYDVALRPWVDALFRAVDEGYVEGVVPEMPAPEPRVALGVVGKGVVGDCGKWAAGEARGAVRVDGGTAEVQVVEARVGSNVVVTDQEAMDDEREVRHIELDLSHGAASTDFATYSPGDIVHVLPRNRPSAVDAFFTLFPALDRDAVFDVLSGDRSTLNITLPCTLAAFVAAQIDLSSMPRRRFFERLAAFASDALQREKLLQFASGAGAQALVQYAYREKRTVLIAFRDFPSARPPLSDVVDMLPRLRSRPFSIASSREAHGAASVHVCAAIVRYTTPLRFARVGVCSAFWTAADVGDIVPVYLERGRALRFRADKPAVLVGPGTGVAPMRSFVSSLTALPVAVREAQPFRVLYFGCRHARGDFLYEKEWSDAVREKRLERLETAFSRDRDGAGNVKKVYVQKVMSRHAAELWAHLSEEAQGCVYIAGAAGDMPKAVRAVIVNAGVSVGNLSQKAAEKFVKRLEATGRLQVECW